MCCQVKQFFSWWRRDLLSPLISPCFILWEFVCMEFQSSQISSKAAALEEILDVVGALAHKFCANTYCSVDWLLRGIYKMHHRLLWKQSKMVNLVVTFTDVDSKPWPISVQMTISPHEDMMQCWCSQLCINK